MKMTRVGMIAMIVYALTMGPSETKGLINFPSRSLIDCVKTCAIIPKCVNAVVVKKTNTGMKCLLSSKDDNVEDRFDQLSKIYIPLKKRASAAYLTQCFKRTFRRGHQVNGRNIRQPNNTDNRGECSCYLAGYGPYQKDHKYLFASRTLNKKRRMFIYDEPGRTSFKGTKQRISSKDFSTVPVPKLRQFFILHGLSKYKSSIDTMCFDGTNRKSLVTGNIWTMAYDSIRGLIFYMEEKDSNFLNVHHKDSHANGRTLLKIDKWISSYCFSIDALSQTLLFCTLEKIDNSKKKFVTVYFVDYKDINNLRKHKVYTFEGYEFQVKFMSQDTIILSYDGGRTYTYNITSMTETTIFECPFPSETDSWVGIFGNVAYSSCSKKDRYSFFFYSLNGTRLSVKKLKANSIDNVFEIQ